MTAVGLPSGTAQRQRRRIDSVLVAVVAMLVGIGFLATYTASYRMADAFWGDGTFFLKRQVLWALIGTAAATLVAGISYRQWRRYSVPIMAGTLFMLLVMLIMGATRFGAARWITASGSIQPSELAKLAMIIYLADWLSSKRGEIRDVTLGLIPYSILVGLVCGLIVMQNHLSTAILIAVVAVAMFFTAGAELRQLVASGAIAATALTILVVRVPYRMARVKTYLDPTTDPTDAGFQVLRSMEAISRGGLFGVGLGNGQHKHIVPVPHTDAVFAVLGEELGLIGTLALLALFGLLAWRGIRIAMGVGDRFASLLALGITAWLTAQAVINIGVVTSVIPFTGVPLPFVSYGGSSLVVCLAGVGLLLNLSRHVDPNRRSADVHNDFGWRNRRSRLSRAYRAKNRGQSGG